MGQQDGGVRSGYGKREKDHVIPDVCSLGDQNAPALRQADDSSAGSRDAALQVLKTAEYLTFQRAQAPGPRPVVVALPDRRRSGTDMDTS